MTDQQEQHQRFVLREEFVRHQAEVGGSLKRIEEFMSQMRPIILRQSGDEAEWRNLRREVDALHEAKRSIFEALHETRDTCRERKSDLETALTARITRLEGRMLWWAGSLAGLFAAIQLILQYLLPMVLR